MPSKPLSAAKRAIVSTCSARVRGIGENAGHRSRRRVVDDRRGVLHTCKAGRLLEQRGNVRIQPVVRGHAVDGRGVVGEQRQIGERIRVRRERCVGRLRLPVRRPCADGRGWSAPFPRRARARHRDPDDGRDDQAREQTDSQQLLLRTGEPARATRRFGRRVHRGNGSGVDAAPIVTRARPVHPARWRRWRAPSLTVCEGRGHDRGHEHPGRAVPAGRTPDS